MKNISIAGAAIAVALMVSPGYAADMPTKMPTKAPIAAPLYNWTGFYAGLNIGGSWGRQDNSLVTITGVTLLTNSDHIDGVIGGGQVGYNWQFNQLVLGIEADIQASGQKGSGSFALPGGGALALVIPATSISYSDKLEWFGTVRGRAGWANDRWLAYLTGGWAFGHGTTIGTTTIGATTTTFSGSKSYNGWTIGGGLEYAFNNHWSTKAEYLYIDFGNGPTVPVSAVLNIVGGKMTDNILRAGLNYKF